MRKGPEVKVTLDSQPQNRATIYTLNTAVGKRAPMTTIFRDLPEMYGQIGTKLGELTMKDRIMEIGGSVIIGSAGAAIFGALFTLLENRGLAMQNTSLLESVFPLCALIVWGTTTLDDSLTKKKAVAQEQFNVLGEELRRQLGEQKSAN